MNEAASTGKTASQFADEIVAGAKARAETAAKREWESQWENSLSWAAASAACSSYSSIEVTFGPPWGA